MLVSELLFRFYQVNGLEEPDNYIFIFQLKELKLTSCKNLKEAGITVDSIIEIKSEKIYRIYNKKFNFIILSSLNGAYADNMNMTQKMMICGVVLNFNKLFI